MAQSLAKELLAFRGLLVRQLGLGAGCLHTQKSCPWDAGPKMGRFGALLVPRDVTQWDPSHRDANQQDSTLVS